MGSAFSSGNSVFVRTDRSGYLGGDVVQGTAYMNVVTPFRSRGVFVKISGAEISHWRERRSRTVSTGKGSRTVVYYVSFGGKREFFNVRIPLFTFPMSEISVGQYAFPFTFRLPEGLPGSFYVAGPQFSATVVYKIKSECQVEGMLKPNIKHTQVFHVFEKLVNMIQPAMAQRSGNVKVCCCVSRGFARVEARVDKNAYTPGELVNTICEVDNQSKSKMRRVKCRLIRHISLWDGSARRFHHSAKLVEVAGEGVLPFNGGSGSPPALRNFAFRLIHNGPGVPGSAPAGAIDGTAHIAPDTHGMLVRCDYYIEVSGDVAMSIDVASRVPIRIYAAQPTMAVGVVYRPDGSVDPSSTQAGPSASSSSSSSSSASFATTVPNEYLGATAPGIDGSVGVDRGRTQGGKAEWGASAEFRAPEGWNPQVMPMVTVSIPVVAGTVQSYEGTHEDGGAGHEDPASSTAHLYGTHQDSSTGDRTNASYSTFK